MLQTIANGHGYGFEIMRATDPPSGRVSPILRCLEAGGLVESSWEDPGRAHEKGRPPAAWLPARRASAVDPVLALRSE